MEKIDSKDRLKPLHEPRASISSVRDMALHRIVSGGQTGADRAALDACLEFGFPCGGWCPADRRADDGPLSRAYPLVALATGGYRQRTILNVKDADGTVLFFQESPLGGTRLTLDTCIRLHRPHLLVDVSRIPAERAAVALSGFTRIESIGILNVAGSSERRNPGMYAFVRKAIEAVLELHRAGA